MSDRGEPEPSDQTDQSDQPDQSDELRGSNVEKNPDEWVTGDQPMTGAQASYLRTLSDQAGVEFEADLTKAQASKRIDELQVKTGRGRETR